MHTQQNFYSPVGSPQKQNDSSPAASPLKMPRPTTSTGNSYQPVGRDQIIGKPIEIIPGKFYI